MSRKIILAYSGGLDTSVAIKWLMDKGYEVICYMADIGQGKDVEPARRRAIKIGASKCIVEDLRKNFVADYIFPTLKAGALYQDKYNLATALSRPLIAERMVGLAKKETARFVSHGCTGKGNDQVRFEVTFQIKDPNLKVIAPLREWELATREDEIDYARKHNLPIEQTKKKSYSIDSNLWGTSVEGGRLEDAWREPAKDTYVRAVRAEKAPARAQYITVDFKKGLPVAINGKVYPPIELIQKLRDIGARYGVGRVDVIEDRLIGIKSREVYEAPASSILYAAHSAIEEMVLDRQSRVVKRFLSERYAELVYNGLWFTPLKGAIDAFVERTQKNVSGRVKLKLYKGACVVCGRKSAKSRYSIELATYGKGDIFDQSLARGFIELWALPYKSKK